uniref:NADH dehydrogenase subunit 2 n=1 Tax=Myladina unguiculina TaxID=3037634 RepID=UPI00243578C1|nr:NADH dehydrogenase subunit 2 [Myladina unguiculina]WEX49732.1 NADH dehydrogenase subunit 2 [Myladina unguiculina]
MKMYKLIFFNTMIMGTLISISSYSWFAMWMGLEINLLSIIPLFNNQKNIFSSESSLKYFITQAIASMILLMSVIMLLLLNEFITPLVNFYFLMMMNSALLTKLGAAPFHFWFPEVMEGLSWMNSLMLLTWQKIAPMVLIMNNSINTTFLLIVIITCLMVSTIMGFNQVSMRKIMAFSSINHIAWMLSTMFMSYSMWLLYFTIYCMINFNIIMLFHKTNTFYASQVNNIMNKNKMVKFSYMMNFMSLGGLPPFIGFLPKWFVINWLIMNKLYLITFIMIIMTLIMLYIYMRIIFSSMLMSFNEPKSTELKMSNFALIMINFMTMISLIICTLLFNFY